MIYFAYREAAQRSDPKKYGVSRPAPYYTTGTVYFTSCLVRTSMQTLSTVMLKNSHPGSHRQGKSMAGRLKGIRKFSKNLGIYIFSTQNCQQ